MIPFKGTVIDAGGGEVRILVDRDTVEYPNRGAYVEITATTTGKRPPESEVELIRARHRQHVTRLFPAPGICVSCQTRWPCDVHKALGLLS